MNDCYREMRKIYEKCMISCAWFSWYDFVLHDDVLLMGDVPVMAIEEAYKIFTHVYMEDEINTYVDIKLSAILIFGGLGKNRNIVAARIAQNMLHDNGVMLWAVDNKLGSRFLCGDKHLSNECDYYTLVEWKKFFQDTGLPLTQVYYLLPGWQMTGKIYTNEKLPYSGSLSRKCFKYTDPKNLFTDEQEMLSDVIDCNMFPQMANSFLFEYRRCTVNSKILSVDISPTKGYSSSSVLLHCTDGIIKKALYNGGTVKNIYDNGESLRERGIKVIPQKYIDAELRMPYIAHPLLSKMMRETALESVDKFRSMLEKFWQCILKSSEAGKLNEFPINNIECGPILKNAYIDMIPTNAFFVDGEYVFFDQEYVYANFPAKFIMFRALLILYADEQELEMSVSLNNVKKWFGLDELWSYFQKVEEDFIQQKLMRWDIYKQYYENGNVNKIDLLRNRINILHISDLGADNLFIGMENKDIILFGAGKYCDRYLAQYGVKYKPKYIVDNDRKKWQKFKEGIEIFDPSKLTTEKADEVCIIICSSYAVEISQQLMNLGINKYRVY